LRLEIQKEFSVPFQIIQIPNRNTLEKSSIEKDSPIYFYENFLFYFSKSRENP
jgi:hypothetical protein